MQNTYAFAISIRPISQRKTMVYADVIEESSSCTYHIPPRTNFAGGVIVRHFEVTFNHISCSQWEHSETQTFLSLVLQMFFLKSRNLDL